MSDYDEIDSPQYDSLTAAFSNQLHACLEECARGRRGLFAESATDDESWPEAARLRQLAVALQSILAQTEERNALCEEFLDLCSIHGESDPGEARLARAFLARIEKGEVGKTNEEERKKW
jgi:hypothetical protein